MPREKPAFREILDRLDEAFPEESSFSKKSSPNFWELTFAQSSGIIRSVKLNNTPDIAKQK